VVGVAQNNFGANLPLQIAVKNTLDGSRRTNRHKNGRTYVAVRRVQAAAACRSAGIGMEKVEFQCWLQMLLLLAVRS
jgi:hypothetical protein